MDATVFWGLSIISLIVVGVLVTGKQEKNMAHLPKGMPMDIRKFRRHYKLSYADGVASEYLKYLYSHAENHNYGEYGNLMDWFTSQIDSLLVSP